MAKIKVLFLTYVYPPQKFPRSVQISHLVQGLHQDFDITIITSEPEKEGDLSLLSFTPMSNVLYAKKSCFTNFIEQSKGHSIKKEILPDFQYLWHFDLFRKTQHLVDNLSPDIVITFGYPMSTHITGLKLKKKYPHLKWIAHFSDPWVDNIFNDYNIWTRWVNNYYQTKVFHNADHLLFTSLETINLVTKTYPKGVRLKSICLPHTFNETLYKPHRTQRNKKIILRYIGNFYGNRQPNSFLAAIQKLPHNQREELRIEFIGPQNKDLQQTIKNYDLNGIGFSLPSVSYIHSLSLMNTADILLVIDAPTEESPFLPSKLVDYIGANKPIFGITPPGTSQKLIEEMGFLVAHPNDQNEIANKLMMMIQKIQNGTINKIPSHIRERYSSSKISKQMKYILNELSHNIPPCTSPS